MIYIYENKYIDLILKDFHFYNEVLRAPTL